MLSQYLTVDIQQFSNKLAEIYSNIAKPVLTLCESAGKWKNIDVCSLYNYQLSRNVGAEGLVVLTILVQISAGLCESINAVALKLVLQKAAKSGNSESDNTAIWGIRSSRR